MIEFEFFSLILRAIYRFRKILIILSVVIFLIFGLLRHKNSPPDQSMCYHNYVFDKTNEKLKFMDISDDEFLKKTNGKNIFFHVTNCIHNGIPEINAR